MMSKTLWGDKKLELPAALRGPVLTAEREAELKKTFEVILDRGDPETVRAEILDYFQRTWQVYEKLFECMTERAFYMRGDPLRHPIIFYYGHTAVFFINKLRLAKVVTERINLGIESQFAVGVDEMSWDDLLEDHYDWPPIETVKQYRDQVRNVVEHAIKTLPIKIPIRWNDQWWAIMMGIEHERIHLETSSVLIRELPIDVLLPCAFWGTCPKSSEHPPPNELLQVTTEPTVITVGKPYEHATYGWDSEYAQHSVTVRPFNASKFLVTNREFLAFVENGGYRTQAYWTDEGWRWANYRSATKVTHPIFWVPAEEKEESIEQEEESVAGPAPARVTKWRFRNMIEVRDMPWDWPVEVNCLEAQAFCVWLAKESGKNIRLPTEDEYQLLRTQEIGGVDKDYPHWDKAPGNINLEYFASSTPVDYFPPSPGGFYDVIGNVWQHTSTYIDSFPGFRVHPWYDDFSVPTFDTKHNMIKGGSWISTGNEAAPEARFAFRRHFFQHAGFRYIESSHEPDAQHSEMFEHDMGVAIYSEFHYAPESEERFGIPNFPKALAQWALQTADKLDLHVKRALDVGCAVGRGTFELVKGGADHALGLDCSARFIRHAVALREEGTIYWVRSDEGDLCTNMTRTLSGLKLADARDRCEFYQTDACNLDPRYQNFDLVVAGNLLESLYHPSMFLEVIHERVNTGGLLIIASTYSWDEATTPKNLWLGGYVDAEGEAVSTVATLTNILSKHFDQLDDTADMPYLMRLNARKFEHGISHVTVWRRRSDIAPE